MDEAQTTTKHLKEENQRLSSNLEDEKLYKDMVTQYYDEINQKEEDFVKKLAQTQFELHLEKESLFTVTWANDSLEHEGTNNSLFDLQETSEDFKFPKTLHVFMKKSLNFIGRPKLPNLN